MYNASMTVLLVALCASIATFLGGALALSFRDKLHLILGFSAGAVAGLAFFDLLPEAIDLGTKSYAAQTIALAVAVGFFVYLVFDRVVFLHSHDEGDAQGPSPARGTLGALTLATHSFLDGVAIGVGFQAAPTVGLVIAAAVLTHDFSDGINTVTLVLRNGGSWRDATRWLMVDAAAPLFGAAATLGLSLENSATCLLLAGFAGSFIYLSASDLIPESHHRHPRALTTMLTLFGALLIYVVVQVVH